MARMIERYRSRTRLLHWTNLFAFMLLLLTGLVLFVPPLWGVAAQGSWTRLIHRVGAVVFLAGPLIFAMVNWRATLESVKEAFNWGPDDIGWLKAAPRYYFLNDERAMPPQEHMNTGQKMWWLIVLSTGVVFGVSGGLMWFGKTTLPSGVLQWSVFAHEVAYIVVLPMFFVHIYLSVLHPLMTGVWRSMLADGQVPAEYVKSHHARWYARISGKHAGSE